MPINLSLHLDPSRAHLYEFHALAVPLVTKIAVRLTSVSVPTRFTRLSSSQIYTTSYRGFILKPPKNSEEPEVITPAKGIYLSPNWERLGTSSGAASKLDMFAFSPDRNTDVKNNTNPVPVKRGFTLRAWIPVPTSLFENKETCTFRVDARAWVDSPYRHNDNGQNPAVRQRRHRYDVENGPKWEIGNFFDEDLSRASCNGDQLGIMEASRFVTVSHLQKNRDMS